MELNRLFRRMVFAQAMLAIVASCVAEGHLGLFLAAGTLGALAWYVMESGAEEESGLPRWAVTVGLVAAMANLPYEIFQGEGGNLVQAISHFTLWLQLLLLLGRKNHRDYPPIIVLSLLQMLAGSLMGTSLVFGLLLLVYCVVTLFTVVLYQLKSVAEQVREHRRRVTPPGVAVTAAPAIVGRGHRWQFRAIVLTIGAVCGLSGAVTFALMPRHDPSPVFASLLGVDTGPTITGFTTQVRLMGAPLAGGSQTPVLTMVVKDEHGAADSESSWLLRGTVLDRYESESRTWSSGRRDRSLADDELHITAEGVRLLQAPAGVAEYAADITLLESRYRNLFQLAPVSFLASPDLPKVLRDPLDGQFSLDRRLSGAIRYSLRTTRGDAASLAQLTQAPLDEGVIVRGSSNYRLHYAPWPPESDFEPIPTSRDNYASGWHVQKDRIRNLALAALAEAGLTQVDLEQPSTRGGQGPSRANTSARTAAALPASRVLADAALAATSPADGPSGGPRTTTTDPEPGAKVAHALQRFLAASGRYTYSLDVPAAPSGVDPIAQFLFVEKRGHCELFASALAALARSLDMRARLATGYLASEYNPVGQYYVVRDSQAHAWTEIEIAPDVWQTFDASPAADVSHMHDTGGWLAGLRYLYEYLEYTWSQRIMGFDRQTQEQTLGQVRKSLEQSQGLLAWADASWEWIQGLFQRFRRDLFTQVVVAVILLFLVIAIVSLIHRLIVRRRRLIALQLTLLPRQQRRLLVRELRFYLTMLETLERHGFRRPTWQSPFGFAQQLAGAGDGQRFQPVVVLTELFYEIRFGYRRLNDERRQQIRKHLRQLDKALTQK